MFNLNEGLFAIWRESLATNPPLVIGLAVGLVFVCMAVGYLLGSLNSAIIVSRLLYHDDIRRHGSGNAGLTNMLRTYGKGAAGLTLLGDFSKTAVSILIAGILGGFSYFAGISTGIASYDFPYVYIAGFFSIIGHIFPIFYKFKGGKGVLCTAVMALILTPIEFAILLLLFIAIVAMSKYVSLGSVSVAILYPVIVHGHFTVAFGSGSESGIVALITILVAILIVWCHRENLERISQGKERKLSIGGKKKSSAADTAQKSDTDSAADTSRDPEAKQ